MIRRAALALILATFATWIVLSVVYGVDLPFLDQWDRPLLQIGKMFEGTLAPGDFWVQHNESRKVVPTAISLGLAAVVGRFDTHIELLVGGLLMAAVVWGVWWLARAARMAPAAGPTLALVYLALAASSRTIYFHLYSVTFERLIPELAIVGSLALILGRGLTFGTALAASALLAAGQYSYAGAVAGWLLVPAFAAVAFRRELRTAGPPLALIVACGTLSSLAYFHAYQTPPWHTPLRAILDQPPRAIAKFAATFLGNPFSSDPRLGAVAAAAALATCAVAGGLALRRHERAALAWLALAGYSVSQALLATITRLPMDPGHAVRPDYVIHGAYLYVAAAGLLCLIAPRIQGVLVAACAVSLLFLFGDGARRDLRLMRDSRLGARACIREPSRPCDTTNPWLNPGLDVVRDRAARARSHRAW